MKRKYQKHCLFWSNMSEVKKMYRTKILQLFEKINFTENNQFHANREV